MSEHDHRPIYRPVQVLPRGPNRLDRSDVAASQRERLRTAVVALVAEQGYGAVTITAIARRARVSPNVFYQHFSDKVGCYVDAFDSFAGVVADHLAQASGHTIDTLVVSMVTEYLALLDREREAARAFMIEIDATGARGRERRRAAYALAAAVIDEQYTTMRTLDPALPAIERRVFLAILTAVHGLAADALETSQPEQLIDLVPEIRQWITALIAGHGPSS